MVARLRHPVRPTVGALLWGAIAILAAWAAVRVLGLERGFPLVAMMAVTPYAALAAYAVALAAAAFRRPWCGLAAVACAGALTAAIAPRAVGSAARGAAGAPALRVLTANVAQGSVDAATLQALVRRERPDVICLQEITPELRAGIQASALARTFHWAVGLVDTGAHGVMLYSRRPIGAVSIGRGFTNPPVAATVTLRRGGSVRVWAFHAGAPIGPRETARWASDLRRLPGPAPGGPPTVLAGDFNATLDHHELRALIGRGYRDAGEATGGGLVATWRSALRPPLTIDHVLADRRLAIRGYEVRGLDGSDHRALVAELARSG
jgi:endonuclease/exonuclease/phosphatase family metal-dependent hydrolase